MKDENTTIDNVSMNNEETQLDNEQKHVETPLCTENASNTNRAKWVHIAGSAGTGLLLGAASTMLMSATPVNNEAVQEDNINNDVNTTEGTDPVNIESVSIASDVTDDMSFSEAFATARHELGAGGAFEWHGNVYSTYYAEEWNSMTEEQQADYYSHAMHAHSSYHAEAGNTAEVVDIDSSHAHLAAHDTMNTATITAHGGDTADTDNITTTVSDDMLQSNDSIQTNDMAQADITETDNDIEVEILGIIHDDDTGANAVTMNVDGHDAMLVDVDNNNTIDAMVIDMNDDGIVTADEITGVSDQNLTLDQFYDTTVDPDPDNIYADNNDLPDYTNDANVDNYYA